MNISQRFTREVQLKRTRYNVWCGLQLLETEIPSEPLATALACEPLNYAVLVDAKARIGGYDLGTDYRQITDYLRREGRPLEKREFTVYYAIISQRFKRERVERE